MAKRFSKELGIFVLLLAVCLFVYSRNANFLTPLNLQNTSRLIGMFGILSLGLSCVVVTGGIDLSVGSSLSLLGVLLSIGLVEKKLPPGLVVIGILGIGVVLGLIHAFLVTRAKLQPFIVTLCGLLIYRGLARYVANDESKGFGNAEGFQWVKDLAVGNTAGIPNPFLLLIFFTIVFGILLHKSVFGRYLFAIGRNEEAARFSGVPTRRVEATAYVMCAFLTAVAAILFAFYTNSVSPSNHGNFYESYAIAAAVLGGFSLRGGEGSIIGVLLGAALLQVLQNLVNLLGVPSSLNFPVMGGVILLGVMADNVLLKKKGTAS